jgi:hypothetical protein
MTVTTSNPTVTPALLIEKVRELAARFPNVVYEAPTDYSGKISQYTRGANAAGCGCILGIALTELNPAFKPQLEFLDAEGRGDIPEEDFDDGSGCGVHVIGTVLEVLHLQNPTRAEHLFLQQVQNAQDEGKTWSECVALADKYLSLSL